ncbi:MAG TPA: right-handed parallel beta-helix repeat-containing protein [bacterium]|nr:right-handed parallel beta-helix repeat-containing protein [bacterium]
MDRKPAAFFSYAHQNDDQDGGRLSTMRERLEKEVIVQSGDPFVIFQDRRDIEWGKQWRKRIEEGLDASTVLIVVVTPGYLKRPECRNEYQLFWKWEKSIGRDDLIFPILYVDTPALTDEAKRKQDPIAEDIAKRQWIDWINLRFEPFTSPEVGKRLAEMAIKIRDAVEAGIEPPKKKAKAKSTGKKVKKVNIEQSEVSSISTIQKEKPNVAPVKRKEPPTLIVDPMRGRGDHNKISAAIRQAEPGTRILVRPGLYKESLIIDKPLEIIGDGLLEEIIVESYEANVVKFQTEFGRLINLTLRQCGEGNWYSVNIVQGCLELEGCDISSQSQACLAVHGGADPRVRRNRIHDGRYSGVFIYERGKGTFEDNEIFGNGLSGIATRENGDPIVRRNRIHDGKQSGVYVYESGKGTFEDNEIFGNALSGIATSENGDPTVRRNRIYNGKQSGVYVYKNGRGTFEDNEIFGNESSGIITSENGDPIVRRNRIKENRYYGIRVYKAGKGTYEENQLIANKSGNWSIEKGCEPNVTRKDNKES